MTASGLWLHVDINHSRSATKMCQKNRPHNHILLTAVTFICHRATRATTAAAAARTAARAFAGFPVLDQAPHREEYCDTNERYDQDVTPVSREPFQHLFLLYDTCVFLCRSEQKIAQTSEHNNSCDESYHVHGTCEQETDLVDHQ